MHRTALFLAGATISLIIVQSYFFTHLIVGVALGTVLTTFVTTIVRYPNASLENSFFLSAGWLMITYVTASFLPDTESSALATFAAYLLLINAIYRPPKLRPVIMLSILSTIFRKSISMVLLLPATDFVNGLIF